MRRIEWIRRRQIDRAVQVGVRWQAMAERLARNTRELREGGPTRAESPERVRAYEERETRKRIAYARAGVTDAFFRERRIGPTLDLDEEPPNEAARVAGRPVGRVVELDQRGTPTEGFATGFLIAPGIMLTNHHVFASIDECDNCGIQFGYEGHDGDIASGTTFALEARRFFFTHGELDFSVVAVATKSVDSGTTIQAIGSLPLIPTVGKILVGQTISIIQYPDGGPKRYGVRDNELLIAPGDADLFLQYTTDTLPGSSGSPCFNKDWEVVALHHSGVPEIKNGQIVTMSGTPWQKGMPDSEIHWIANEGARASRICAALRAAQVSSDEAPTLARLVSTFHEDLSTLPAIQTAREGDTMAPDVRGPNGDGTNGRAAAIMQGANAPISITVNGNATFNFGRGAQLEAVAPKVAEPKVAEPRAARLLPSAIEKKLRFDPDYDNRPGYDRDFLDARVPLPKVADDRADEILESGDTPLVLKYHHYSLVMNKRRRLQMWSAVNVDYTPSKRRMTRDEFGTDTWVPDPRVAGNVQIEDAELYKPAAKFDRGHIVRRDDTAWGDTQEEEILANSDSFHWTNCTPQHEQFNRDEFGFHGLWGGLENQIKSQSEMVGNRMSIFAGPVLDNTNDIEHDFGGGLVKVPVRFWKVVMVMEAEEGDTPSLAAYGFVLDQQEAIEEFGLERFSAGKFKTFQVALTEISNATGVTFAQDVLDADAMATEPNESRKVLLSSVDEIRTRRARPLSRRTADYDRERVPVAAWRADAAPERAPN